MGLISVLYEWKLKTAIKNQGVPGHIVLALAETDLLIDINYERLRSFVSWCREFEINIVTIYVSIIDVDPELSKKICEKLSVEIPPVFYNITHNINVITRWDKKIKKYENQGMRLDISLGYSGKYELTKAIKEIMVKIKSGVLNPEDIDEKIIESHLLFRFEP